MNTGTSAAARVTGRIEGSAADATGAPAGKAAKASMAAELLMKAKRALLMIP